MVYDQVTRRIIVAVVGGVCGCTAAAAAAAVVRVTYRSC